MCSEASTSREDLAKVRASRDETERRFACQLCQRRFFTRKDVERHQVVHTGRRDFSCPQCQQRFGRKDHVIRHVRKAHGTDDRRQFRLSVALSDVAGTHQMPHRLPDANVATFQVVPVAHLPISCVPSLTWEPPVASHGLDEGKNDTWHPVSEVDDSIYQPADTFPIELANELFEFPN